MSTHQPIVSLKQVPDLIKGIPPLLQSGVLGLLTPQAIVKALKAIYQWEFLPASLLALGEARAPHHPAIIDDAGSISYRELHQATDTFAHALFRSGIRERDRIGMLCRNHRNFILTLCAHGRLGTDIVLLNTGASAQQTLSVLTEQKVDLLVIDEEFLPLLPEDFDLCPVVIAWEDGKIPSPNPDWSYLSEILRTTPKDQSIPRRPRRGRTIILTSGTTGTPKGARRPEPSNYLPASSIMSRIPLKHHQKYFIVAPMFHTWGFANIQLAMALRGTMVLQRHFDPSATAELIQKHKPHTIAIVPTMLQRILENLPESFTPETSVITACGEALPPALITKTHDVFGPVLYNLYGSTEVSWATIAQPEELQKYPRTAGRPPLATRLLILDDNNQECAEDEVGRIFIGNAMLFEGYTRPGVDKNTYHGLVDTGDLGYIHEGLLFISGRSDDMIVSGGENVFPQETQDIIAGMPGIADVAVSGVPDERFGQALAAYLVTDKNLTEEEKRSLEEEINQRVKEQLARHCVPHHYFYLESIPRNEVGKIMRRFLPTP